MKYLLSIIFFIHSSILMSNCVLKNKTILSSDSTNKILKTSTIDTNQIVSNIEAQSRDINSKLDSLKKIQKKVFGYSTEGGLLVGYYDGDEIKKIEAKFLGETGRAKEEYYFDEGNIFFIIKEEQQYDKPVSLGEIKIIKTELNYYYIINNNLILWLTNKKEKIDPRVKSYKEEIEYFLKDIKEFNKILSDN